ncbi:MAG: toll/interleukin-1 receptor domain-containing protein [Balneolaceae bacterium]
MANIWITYAWKDNEAGDIDYIAQELESSGLTVKLDRWNISAGKRLWEQISNFITDQNESDAWLLIATSNSLESEPCKEEFAYALQRALESRGIEFPVIALFLGDVDNSLIPPAIKTRLFVSITDPDWKERIVAAAEGRQHESSRKQVDPFYLKIHNQKSGKKTIAIEVRPRAGVWAPFVAAIPLNEKDDVDPSIMIGPSNVPTGSGMLVNTGSENSPDNRYWVMGAGNQATPTQSYYIWCNKLPSELIFGVNNGSPQYRVQF